MGGKNFSCPTYSIHATDRTPAELREAQDGLPARVPGVVAATAKGEGAEGVYYTGWSTEKSYAGCAYLIVRQGGNILVDSPRYNPVLARRLEALGGVRYMFLTHRDDVGDHQAWARHFGATRILHELEVNERQGTDAVEVKLRGDGPWVIDAQGQVVEAAAGPGDVAAAGGAAQDGDGDGDVTFIFTPGHTRGHVCMYYAPYAALFSGDHLCSAAGQAPDAPQDDLYVYKDFNWYDFPLQLASVAKLLQYDWLHVLPAHGRRMHLRDAAARLAAVSTLLMKHGADAGPDVLAAAAAAVPAATAAGGAAGGAVSSAAA
ncbi:hypothetical protein GPECTOR_115g327 [Gonium pectorale]|uniref:Metallo-beta-lactamase domain-containing protein n=1 Tax=Gonium pectorale TaxID=33097 RepID=A0A150FYZ3_GONPE|nr:hypothetical protein GPECTOR_115g327 [Gonium pectorale]|eukprot:KXZ42833.1 hypothetical protein GPECTOR_115g327 [Gonium pectorale]